MAREIITPNRWLLQRSHEEVRPLERVCKNTVRLGNSDCLKLKDVRLIVPEGIEVYDVLNQVKNGRHMLFTSENNDLSSVYLSIVSSEGLGKHKRLNYGFVENMGVLLEYPWLNRDDSARVYDKLCRKVYNNIFALCKIKQYEHPYKHPFLKD